MYALSFCTQSRSKALACLDFVRDRGTELSEDNAVFCTNTLRKARNPGPT